MLSLSLFVAPLIQNVVKYSSSWSLVRKLRSCEVRVCDFRKPFILISVHSSDQPLPPVLRAFSTVTLFDLTYSRMAVSSLSRSFIMQISHSSLCRSLSARQTANEVNRYVGIYYKLFGISANRLRSRFRSSFRNLDWMTRVKSNQ